MTHKPLYTWLFLCAAAVFLMVMVGAITRLTESGLSIVEWKPLVGAVPPLNEAQWQTVFDQYKQTPEFQKKNFWMGMDDFKKIYFWEWFHRLWGRLIGVIYALPLLWFWARGKIPTEYKMPLLGLLVLGGLQGAMGWYMVKSGLVNIPAVSHYRLAAHLSLALLIFCCLVWTGLSLRGRALFTVTRNAARALFPHALFVLLCVLVTILWGAFVAGLDAGLVYNDTFPMMGGGVMPPDMWAHGPAWINLLENHSAVQFTHRWLAMFTVLMIIIFWARAVQRGAGAWPIHALAGVCAVQTGLGIATLLSGVHIILAAAHQAGAVLVLLLLLMVLQGVFKSIFTPQVSAS